MRICLATTSFLPMIGGAEIVVHNLATALTSLGHSVSVMAPRYSRRFHGRVPYELHPVLPGTFSLMARHEGAGSAYFLAEVARLRWKRFDVVNLHFALPLGPTLVRYRRLLGTPLVLTFHGTDIQLDASIGYGLRLDPRLDRLVRLAVDGADGFIAISGSIKEELEKLRPGGTIFEIPNGVDAARFLEGTPGRFRANLGLSEDVPLVLAVGRYHPKKGFEYLLRAMARLRQTIPDAGCVILGRGTTQLATLVERLGLQQHTRLVEEIGIATNGGQPPTMPSDAVVEAYRGSDVFASPSLIEGCSLAVLEAMAAGLTVVATDAPGNRDLIKDGHNGLLCRPRDPEDLARKLLTIIRSPHLRAQISRHALETGRAHDWRTIAATYVRVYEDVIGMRMRRVPIVL